MGWYGNGYGYGVLRKLKRARKKTSFSSDSPYFIYLFSSPHSPKGKDILTSNMKDLCHIDV